MKKIISSLSYLILIILFTILYQKVFSGHHRYHIFAETCKTHRGAAVIFPECMGYIYGDEAKDNINQALEEFIDIKNNKLDKSKEELMNIWIRNNFNSNSLAKRITGVYFFKNNSKEIITNFTILLEKFLVELFLISSRQPYSYTYKVNEVPIFKKRMYNITTYVEALHATKEKVELTWVLERRYGKYKIIDLKLYNTYLSDYLKDQFNINSNNPDPNQLISNTKFYLSKIKQFIKVEENDFVFILGKKSINNTINNPNIAKKLSINNDQENEKLKKELKKLKEQLAIEEEKIALDTDPPIIVIKKFKTINKKGIVEGTVTDNYKVTELTINNEPISINENGDFIFSAYVPTEGLDIKIEAYDAKGLSTIKSIKLNRVKNNKKTNKLFASLNPIKSKGKSKKNAYALIIGINNYLRVPTANYADRDALFFSDFSENVLGIKKENIKILRNNKARNIDVKIALKSWLKVSIIANETEVFIFYAGHGLASTDGKELYLLPYDGEPRLLEDTAILRSEIFDTIKSVSPKSVTVFLDTCYSGQNREKDMILADARPIAIVPVESDVPENFTVFSASSGSEISGSLPEADHGLFSYFLMKGLEGDADTNNDKKITNGELHSYVRSNVTRQAIRLGREQTPQLQGDENRVLVEFN